MTFPASWVLYPAVILGSYALTGLVRRYALKRLVDVPNVRSSHAVPTPRGGGLAIVLAFLAGCFGLSGLGELSSGLLLLLLTGLPVGAVGFWDDHGHLPARFRMAAHVAAAVLALVALGGFPLIPWGGGSLDLGLLGTAFGLLWLVWLLNLFNFMDGIDAIAGTEVMFVAAAAAGLMFWQHAAADGVALALLLLAAATLGFQVWNWPPARIFMGDVGSGFVGYVLALLALADMKGEGGLGLPVWLILNGVFLVDASYTLLVRIASGQTWYQAHRSHAYQKAAAIFGEHGRVVKCCLTINLFWLLPWAAAALAWPGFGLAIVVIALLPLFGLAVRLGAGRS